ncbi:CocE/NonD family hydrolase [Kitasatospora sp. NPDC008050]|uniref:CocE/NonD family hydrolase n=1 Tax=Kitasatospora sp. NPDC008050 TaxID=3364021 RepID=UPI0036E4DDD8
MPTRRPRRAAALALATALLTAAPLALAPDLAQAAGAGGGQRAQAAPSLRFTDIPGADGVILKGNVYEPGDGAAHHPLLVLPASWSMNDAEYLVQARRLAEAGYVVVSYTPRGFWGSGGQISVAGPQDTADASQVIDWALAHTTADPARIGMAGVSYGAGISLLAAAKDSRVKAVGAMSGWADLAESLFGSETQHLQAGDVLTVLGYLTGRPSAETRQELISFFGSDQPSEAQLRAWAAQRSVSTMVDRMNANGTAVLLASAWGDSIFPPNQLTDFFQKLTGPKRLELRPGDHATPEILGLAGLPNDVWTDTRSWLDHYVKGVDNGIDRALPVHIEPQVQDGYEDYPSWSAVSSHTAALPLGARDGWNTGALGQGAGTGWQTTITTGVPSGAGAGTVFLSSLAEQFLKVPPLVSVPLLPRPFAAVWQSAPATGTEQVRGTARVHLSVTPSAGQGSLIAYLYDVNALGVGKLITQAPYTFLDRAPGQAFDADFALMDTAYDVPAGHRLALVVGTVDPMYITHNPAGARLAFGSPAGDPSRVSVPLR